MAKEKITISVDERILELIDKQRGDAKRSTYINKILEEYFSPRPPEEQGGGTFVTTLELRKTLKTIHDRLTNLEAVAATVKELESLVYEAIYDTKGKGHEAVQMIKKRLLPEGVGFGLESQEVNQRVDKWVGERIMKHGNIVLERDFSDYLTIPGVEQSVVGFVKHLNRCGLKYNPEKKEWTP